MIFITVGSQVKSCYASIKSAEATLDMLANKTKDQDVKAVYVNTKNVLTDVKKDLKQRVIQIGNEEPQYKS